MARINSNVSGWHVGWLLTLTVILLFSSLALFLFSLYKSAASNRGSDSVAAFFAEFPMHFHSNNGAFDEEVKYYSKGYQYDLLFKHDAVWLNLYADDIDNISNIDGEVSGDLQQENRFNGAQLGVVFVAATTDTDISGIHPAHTEKSRSGVYRGGAVAASDNRDSDNRHSDEMLKASAFLELKYSNIFPGIDAYFHGKQKQLFYDFVLARNANTSAMRVKILGARNANINFDIHGNISIDGNGRKMMIKKPNVYRVTDKGKQVVDGYFFVTRENELRFKATEHGSG